MRIHKTSFLEIQDMTLDYYNRLSSPMDDMYENSLIPKCTYFVIREFGEISGYFAVNNHDEFMQFYLLNEKRKDTEDLFKDIINRNKIKGALVATYDPFLHSLSKSYAVSIKISDLLYKEYIDIDIKPPLQDIVSKVAVLDDLETMLDFFDSIDIGGEWARAYLTKLIQQMELHIYKIGTTIIGSGETRKSISTRGIANIGMAVNIDFRYKGIGTYIINQMKLVSNRKNLLAICSTSNSNIGSQKAIINAGFIQYHTIDRIRFR